ncbi:D-alanyl-D-alanine carboxypeptidase/D-alanyl-D-alanine-endopeptidase [Algoriphagus marinus]|uniref:D-alanyl-D-alanine carboxypeptidase/D-alanyl-D-alanine-endopeptidase n=1 Tax=Algoriphagus marinus TaxID=1925762 RepID=UPI000B0F4CBC|nr:D-alanyl-D-alanine carboxypeptidase [Algoriphagus marinus]
MQKSLLFAFLFLISLTTKGQLTPDQFLRMEKAVGPGSFFNNHLSGFILEDMDAKTVLYEKNSHLNFIPASTTKLFTLFSAITILNDSTQTLRYVTSGDTIHIWGSGDPSWKYKKFQDPGIQKLIQAFSHVVYSDANMDSPAFGYGWQWDDYYYDYSAELTSLPIFGNLLEVRKEGTKPIVLPKRFQDSVYQTSRTIRELERDFHHNRFYYNPANFRGSERYIPLLTSPELFVKLATEATGKTWHYRKDALPENHLSYRGSPIFPMLKEMMLESDNFLAEQLMLMVSDRLFQRLDTERAIEFMLKTYLFDLPDQPKWVDGSGLSRHNLFTPRTMVTLFEKLYRMIPDHELFELLPTGGVSGSLKNNYQAAQPYIFAKTGTMSNNHSLVGLIKTKSGKTYSFAFMNSNYLNKASEVRSEMEKVLLMVRDML